jgi:hypothetical protein
MVKNHITRVLKLCAARKTIGLICGLNTFAPPVTLSTKIRGGPTRLLWVWQPVKETIFPRHPADSTRVTRRPRSRWLTSSVGFRSRGKVLRAATSTSLSKIGRRQRHPIRRSKTVTSLSGPSRDQRKALAALLGLGHFASSR